MHVHDVLKFCRHDQFDRVIYHINFENVRCVFILLPMISELVWNRKSQSLIFVRSEKQNILDMIIWVGFVFVISKRRYWTNRKLFSIRNLKLSCLNVVKMYFAGKEFYYLLLRSYCNKTNFRVTMTR